MSHWQRLVSLTCAALLACATLAPATAEANTRRELYKQYDANGDKRIKGKEAKTFRKEKERLFSGLMAWCEEATDKPKKFDVQLPADKNPKKTKCKKGRIDEPYMKAWVLAGAAGDEGSGGARKGGSTKGGSTRGGSKGGATKGGSTRGGSTKGGSTKPKK